MTNFTPQNYSRRAGSGQPGRVRRSIDGNLETRQRFGNSLEISQSGLLETRLARNSGLKMTKDGLQVDMSAVGDKNRAPLNSIRDVQSGASTADLRETINELLSELRRTTRMRG